MEPNDEPPATGRPAARIVVAALMAIAVGLVIFVAVHHRPSPVAATVVIATDGQTIVGTDTDGAELWRRNIITEFSVANHFRPDRQVMIREVGEPLPWMTELMAKRGRQGTYRTVYFTGCKEFGLIDLTNGEYTTMGSD
jgi:hypothetical protein